MPFVTYYNKTYHKTQHVYQVIAGQFMEYYDILIFVLSNNYFCHALTSRHDRNCYMVFIAMREIFLRSYNMVILKYLLFL